MNRTFAWSNRLRTQLGVATLVGGLALTMVMAPQTALAQDGSQVEPQVAASQTADRPGHDRGNEFLAEALGISVDELDAARAAAHEAAEESGEDRSTLLANELGISEEALDAAQDRAFEAALDQAVEDGKLTEDEAALKQAEHDLAQVIDREALLADVLGITVEELQTAHEEGVKLPELLEALGIDRETVKEDLDAAYEEAVGQAVEENVITEEQAEAILSDETPQDHGRRQHQGRDGDRTPRPEQPDEQDAMPEGQSADENTSDGDEAETAASEQTRPERRPNGNGDARNGRPQGPRR